MRRAAVGVCLVFAACGARDGLDEGESLDGPEPSELAPDSVVIGSARVMSLLPAAAAPDPARPAPAGPDKVIADLPVRFSFRVVATGFEAFDGQVAHRMVVRTSDDVAVALGRRPVVQGVIQAQWDGVLEANETYRMDSFVGEDFGYECHMPPDHAWRVSIPRVAGHAVFYSARPEQESKEACAMFKSSELVP